MRPRHHLCFAATAAAVLLLWLAACSDSAGSKATTTTPGADAGTDGAVDYSGGTPLSVPVSGRTYVKLSDPPAIVAPADPATDKSWDLAFEGVDVFTNSGPSGSGLGSAFGPLDGIVFIGDAPPSVPFHDADMTGGAFLRWWYYGGAPDHALYSRYHVYGVQDGAKQWKVQVLNYYGMRDGAAVSALYSVRWAEVTATGMGTVHQLDDLDGTAGGPSQPVGAKSECLDLDTSARLMLTPDEALASSAWHLCFRRENISVNGEKGGPRNIGAVDLDAAKSATETLAVVVQETSDTQLPHFNEITPASLMGQPFRGDRIVSAFGALWLQPGVTPIAPANNVWLVYGADGAATYLVGFARFVGATATGPGTIEMRIKGVH